MDSRDEAGIVSNAKRLAWQSDGPLRSLLARDHIAFTETSRNFDQWLLPPPTSVTLIINVGEAFGKLPAAFVAGLADTFSVTEPGVSVSCIDVKLTPLGAYRLLALPMSELAGNTVDLSDLVGATGRQLLESVRGTPSWQQRFELLDQFLAGLSVEGPQPSPEVALAWQRLIGSRGQATIGHLAAEVGWSHKHLIAKFKQQVGLPPRTVGRIARFNGLLARIEQSAGLVRWTELIEPCGYYDQAHLDRDFREFAGTTPTDFLTRRASDGPLVGDGVKNVQDRPRDGP